MLSALSASTDIHLPSSSLQLFTIQYSCPICWSVYIYMLSTLLVSTVHTLVISICCALCWPVQISSFFYRHYSCALLSVQLSSLLVSTALHSTGKYRYPLSWSVQISALLVRKDMHPPLSSVQLSTVLCWSVQLSTLLVSKAFNSTGQ